MTARGVLPTPTFQIDFRLVHFQLDLRCPKKKIPPKKIQIKKVLWPKKIFIWEKKNCLPLHKKHFWPKKNFKFFCGTPTNSWKIFRQKFWKKKSFLKKCSGPPTPIKIIGKYSIWEKYWDIFFSGPPHWKSHQNWHQICNWKVPPYQKWHRNWHRTETKRYPPSPPEVALDLELDGTPHPPKNSRSSELQNLGPPQPRQ